MLPMAYGPAPVTAPGGRSATGHTVICFAMHASRQPPTVLSTSLSTRLGPHVGKHPQNAPGDTFISSSQADVERGGQHGGAVAAGAFTEHLVEHFAARWRAGPPGGHRRSSWLSGCVPEASSTYLHRNGTRPSLLASCPR